MEERFSGGLVSSRHPLDLQPSELLIAINAMYLPDAPAPVRAPGWTSYASAPASTTANYFVGIANCRMPHNSINYILTQDVAGVISTATGATGTISLATATSVSGTGVTSMTPLFYNKKWFLLNGIENLVFAASGTGIRFRPHGMAPVPAPFSATATSSSAFACAVTGYYEYWFTEVDKSVPEDEVESAYGASDPVTVYVTSTTLSPKLTFPKPANPNATHFRVYRSTTTKVLSTDKLYPSGYAVGADIPVGPVGAATAVFYIDGGTPGTVTAFCSGLDAYSSSAFATASAATGAPDGTGARYTRASAYNAQAGFPYTKARGLMIYGTTATASGNITGVTMGLALRSSAPDKFQVYVSIGTRATATASVGGGNTARNFTAFPPKTSFPDGLAGASLGSDGIVRQFGQYGVKSVDMSTVGAAYATATMGGQFDDWLPSEYDFTPDDLTRDFAVLISVVQSNVGVADPAGETLDIDGLTLTFHAGGQNAEVGQLYDGITVEVGGQASTYPGHGKPPIASCGAVYEGSLVTNDVEHPGVIAYSMPGFPDYFPGLYQLQLPEPETITFIGEVNNRLVVTTPTKAYRINYLPNEDDASFSRGRAVSEISTIFGCIGPRCAAVITAENGSEELAFASRSGLFATDGFGYRTLNSDVRWLEGIFTVYQPADETHIVGLVNHPPTQTLRLFVSPVENFSHFFSISYAPLHRKQGSGVKWSGPVYCQPGTAYGIVTCAAVMSVPPNYVVAAAFGDLASAANNFRIWREALTGASEQTLQLPTSLDYFNKMRLTTRPIPLGGQDYVEGRVNGMYVYGYESSGAYANAPGPYALGLYSLPRVEVTASQLMPNTSTITVYGTASATGTGIASYIPFGTLNANHALITLQQYAATHQFTLSKLDLVGESYGEAEPK